MDEAIEKNDVKKMIYEIRGKQVMLDRDLAKLYECKNGTKTINLAVKRNLERFPKDFMFQLTSEEFINWFQFETGSNINLKHSSTLPYVFTEQGVAMLSSVLHTEIAIKKSILIMRSFVAMRKYISSSFAANNIEYKLLDHDNRIGLLEKNFNAFKEKNNHLFFEGQIYDAYSLLIDILNKVKKEIIIIDNYFGKELLDILKNIDKKIIVVSKNISDEVVKKYNAQYSNITFCYNNSFHDRFIIIDDQILYHCGSSFKDLGKKCFAINLINDRTILDDIIKKLGVQ